MSIEDKFDEVQQLITIGKEKGYLLYDEVNDLLRADITSSDDLDDLFSTFGSAGHRGGRLRPEVPGEEKPEGDDLELDLTPGALDKTNDPVRMYLREMGTVPLLTREGEVEIAKRIERGKLAVIKSITPDADRGARRSSTMGDGLKAGQRTIRELVIFNDEEITDERLEERAREVLKQIDGGPQGAPGCTRRRQEKLDATPKKDKRKYRARPVEGHAGPHRRVAGASGRSSSPRPVKRRLIEDIKEAVERMGRVQREADGIDTPAEREDQEGRSSRKRSARRSLAQASRSCGPR